KLALTYDFIFQAEDSIRDRNVTGVQTCALPISAKAIWLPSRTSLSLSDLRSGRSTTHEYYTANHHHREGSELRRDPRRGLRPGARVRSQDLPLPLVVHAR